MPVQEITAQMWSEKVAMSQDPVVVNFGAVRCGFCKALEPLYNKLSEEYSGKLVFLKLMTDRQENSEVVKREAIQGTPKLKFYCKGRALGQHVGYAIEPVLKEKIKAFMQEMETCLKLGIVFAGVS